MTATAQNCKMQNILNKYIYNNHHLSVVRLLWHIHRDSEKKVSSATRANCNLEKYCVILIILSSAIPEEYCDFK